MATTIDDDELPKPIGSDPHHQESVVLIYFDEVAGIGGFHRIGHQPNWQGGQGKMISWAGVGTVDGQRFARNLQEPFRQEDRLDKGFGCTSAYRLDVSNGIHWEIDDGPYRASLFAEDYTPRMNPFPHSGEAVTDNFAPRHWESGGRVRGTVDLGDRQFQIDGLCYRDHSWGRRDWASLASHRWVAGTFGPELTFCAASWQSSDGALASFGCVVRNGQFEQVAHTDIVAYMEIDAVTNRGGEVTLTLLDGEIITFKADPAVPGFMSENDNVHCVDQLCTISYKGMRGFCDFETTTNPRLGSSKPLPLINEADHQGLSKDISKVWG
jgi:hypothetical protein